MPCEPCCEINGKPSATEPHAGLNLVNKEKWRAMGAATGTVEYYKCAACGAQLIRDRDTKDSHARWEIGKAK